MMIKGSFARGCPFLLRAGFSRRGFTVTPAGKFGLREWLMAKPNVSFDLDKMKQDGFIIKQIKLKWD
ncbi:MAG: hypothetical protein GY714_00100 [Desulfobacterales bacterium]|nr:hypothetical protein [Desulfobacterales bacterium]